MLKVKSGINSERTPLTITTKQLAKSAVTTFGNLARVEAYRLHLVSVGTIEAIALILEGGLLDGKRCVHMHDT